MSNYIEAGNASHLPGDDRSTRPLGQTISQSDGLMVEQALLEGEGDIRIPLGAPFDCEFEQIPAGAASLISDPLASMPKQLLALAEGIRSSLCEVHRRLGHEVAYSIKEQILKLPNSNRASRFVAVVQLYGEVLPNEAKRAVVERFVEQCFTGEYSIYNVPPNDARQYDFPDFETLLEEELAGKVRPEVNEPAKPLEIADVPDFEGLVNEAVAASAEDFARANAGKQVKCEVVTPAGAFFCEGVAAQPESQGPYVNPVTVTLVRQIDGLDISGYKVDFAMPDHVLLSNEEQFGNGPEPLPEKFMAGIGNGEDSDAPPAQILRKVCQLIGDEKLLVRICVVVTEVRGRIRYQLVAIAHEIAVREDRLALPPLEYQ